MQLIGHKEVETGQVNVVDPIIPSSLCIKMKGSGDPLSPADLKDVIVIELVRCNGTPVFVEFQMFVRLKFHHE